MNATNSKQYLSTITHKPRVQKNTYLQIIDRNSMSWICNESDLDSDNSGTA